MFHIQIQVISCFLSTWFTAGLGTLHFNQTPTGDSGCGCLWSHFWNLVFAPLTTFYSTSHVANLKTFSSYTPKSTIHRWLYIFLTENKRTGTEFLQFPSLDNHLECLLLLFFSWIHPYTTPPLSGKENLPSKAGIMPCAQTPSEFHLQSPSLSLPPSSSLFLTLPSFLPLSLPLAVIIPCTLRGCDCCTMFIMDMEIISSQTGKLLEHTPLMHL